MGTAHDPVVTLAEEIAGVHDRQHREKAFLKHTEQYGITRFAYVSTAHRRHPFHVETNYADEWVQRYLDRNYASVDPVMREAQRTRLPFQWRSALALPAHDSPAAHRLFDEAAEFGLVDGLAVPIHAAGGLSVMSMALDDPALLESSGHVMRQTLHLLAMHYHLACERALCPPADAQPLPRLTPREREVLSWTARGKTGWEIAQILNLAERTVVYHIENARAKLNASSRSQAVALALGLGLITP